MSSEFSDEIKELEDELALQGFKTSQLETSVQAKLIAFTELILKWNKVHDLVSQKEKKEIFKHHILDCLAAFVVFRSNYPISPDYYVDIGTGAGLPGVVWHILFNENVKTYLIEPRSKRVNFLKEVRRRLNLINIEILEARVGVKELPEFEEDKILVASLRALKPDHLITKELLKFKSSKMIWLASQEPELTCLADGIQFTQINYEYDSCENYTRSLVVLRPDI